MSSHRARALLLTVVVVVFLGFFLNLTVNSDRDGGERADAGAGGPRPVVPVYVPRPALLLDGRPLTAQSSAVDVAMVFAVSYFTYDTAKQDEAAYLGSLPRVAESFRGSLATRVNTRWKGEAARKLSSRVRSPDRVRADVTNVGFAEAAVALNVVREVTADGRPAEERSEDLTVTMSRSSGEWQVVDLAVKERG